MPFEPCRLTYDLSRRQRLVTHLGAWAAGWPGLLLAVAFAAVPAALFSRWFLLLLLVGLPPFTWVQRFLAGLMRALFIRTVHMDIVIEENRLGYASRKDREWLFYDWINEIGKFGGDMWGIVFQGGIGIDIPASAVDERYIDHMRAMVEYAKTPDGKRAIAERDRQIREEALANAARARGDPPNGR